MATNQYISKSAIVAEIERRQDYYKRNPLLINAEYCIEEDSAILKFLDILEVKEVDLEKELNIWRHNHFHGRRDKEASGEYLKRNSQLDLAKYFFELGLKVQKRE